MKRGRAGLWRLDTTALIERKLDDEQYGVLMVRCRNGRTSCSYSGNDNRPTFRKTPYRYHSSNLQAVSVL
jgi:hypothetical protein